MLTEFTKLLQTQIINDGEEFIAKTHLSQERLNEIIEGSKVSVDEITKLAIGLEQTEDYVLSLIDQSFKDDIISSRTLIKACERDDIEALTRIIARKRIIKFDNKLYFSTIMNQVNSLSLVSDEATDALIDCLLRHKYLTYALCIMDQNKGLSIKSLKDLDKYGEEIKDKLIYGYNVETIGNPITLPNYFSYMFNSLPKDEKHEVLERIITLYKAYRNKIRTLVKSDVQIKETSIGFLVVDKNKTMLLSNLEMPSIDGFDGELRVISSISNEIQDVLSSYKSNMKGRE